jgi:manganese-transporting P-type ATPase
MDFQRQRYFFDATARPKPRFACAEAPTSNSISSYVAARGMTSAEEVLQLTEVWGKNHISVQTPTFLQLLRLQLLSPIATFQFFVAFLWLLDEYWTYTMWNIVTVVMLESSTVWQRSRTQTMLGGMAPAPTLVHVYRCGKWDTVISHDILPGDIIAISPKRSAAAAAPNNAAEDIIPCDCLLLRGSAVINEASLTGESVPQMKEAVGASDASNCEALEMQGKHRVHVLFSGTSLVTLNEAFANDAISHIPPPPNKGCVAYVLRTGFSSSQGALMQMIEFSQQSVHGDVRETGLALLILLVFALISAAYVMKVGLEKKEKTTHELLLKCVMIITSVIPQQFPMQMAVAVNVALMALMKVTCFFARSSLHAAHSL